MTNMELAGLLCIIGDIQLIFLTMSSIQVCIRMRPFLPEQPAQQEKQRIILQEKQVKVELTEHKQKVFRFNHVLNQEVRQQELYEAVRIQKLVQRVVQGYHSTIFAYGQTGSGKTYTIQGGETQQSEGIIPKVIRDLFKIISKRKNQQRGFRVYLSSIQIYNESIYDLIDPGQGKALKMRWNKHQEFTVQNLFECQCRNQREAVKWWQKGQKNKIMGSHKMNNTSSRSHCMLTLRVQNYSLQDPSDQIESKLEIVDLAGSERQKSTKSQGIVFRQGIEINKSLFILRQVIASLYESSTSGKSGLVPPYRDSKLTSLLKQSIGGNSYCLMIACLNPTMAHFEESLQTLTYASMASYINNIPTVNLDPKVKQNEQLRQHIVTLNKEIKRLEDHIKILAKMVQSNQCQQCKKRKKRQQSQNDVDEAKQPLGILSLPKINDRLVYNSSQSLSPQQGKRTLKSTKEIFQSIAMIRDLVTSNSIYREKIEFFKNFIEKQQKQMFNLMKENQLLRQKTSPEQAYINPNPVTQPSSMTEFAKAVSRVQTDIKNQQKYRLKSLTTNNQTKNQDIHEEKQSIKGGGGLSKINYNQFLKGRQSLQKKEEKRKRRKEKTEQKQ